MKITLKRLITCGLMFIGIGLWLWWDLLQAHSHLASTFRSFFPSAESRRSSSQSAIVSVVRSDDSLLTLPAPRTYAAISYATIEQMVRRAVELAGGFDGIISSGDTVLIKPNLVQQDSSGSGGITDVRVVKALVKLVDEIDHGKIHIIVGDGSPRPYTSFEKASGTTNKAWVELFDVPGYQILKTEMLAAGIDFRISNLNGNSDSNPWNELVLADVAGGGSAQPQGGKYYVHRDVLSADVYISVPVMKIHDTGVTVALKNQIGLAASSMYGMPKTKGVAQNGYQHKLQHLAQAPYNWTDKEIVDLSAIAKIKFVVVDAIACLETQKSPTPSGVSNNQITNLVRMNTIIAGADPVAVDNVCTRLMGLNPDDIEHITLAERNGLGTNNTDSILVVGSTVEATKKRFKKNQAAGGFYGQGNRIWLMNGPFQIGSTADPMNNEFIANEASLAPAAGEAGWSQSLYFINDRINLKDYYVLSTSDQVVSYAFTYFTAPEERDAELWIGSDEALKVYLNGAVAYSYTSTRTFATTSYYSEIKTIHIKKGLNRLLVKSMQKYSGYDFSVNICEVESDPLYRGNRITGLKFTTSPTNTNSISPHKQKMAEGFTLFENFPNPFNPATTIRFSMPVNGEVQLSIYDSKGSEVSILLHQSLEAGTHDVVWNAEHYPTGIYFCRLRCTGSQSFEQTRKLILMK